LPGELFVDRNVASVVTHADPNRLSVIRFTVDVLKVNRTIVVDQHGVDHSQSGGCFLRIRHRQRALRCDSLAVWGERGLSGMR
jgi:carbonic anhydrase